ncbi:MAG: HD domain-containing protein, partial [Kiritimatiellae bacterium]|nr:HD domain-containing protein [Kiritimatiellia bacterium]
MEPLTELDNLLVGAIITGQASLPVALDALRHGAYDFLQKPFSMEDLRALLDRAMKVRLLLLQRRHYQRHLEEMARRKTDALEQALDQVESSYQSTLETLAALIDAREKQTGAHSERVRRITAILARQLKVPEEQRNTMIEGALLHDIGKVAVPDAVLLKPGPLNDEEWAVMRTHPAIGYNLLRTNALLDKVADIVHQHQERYDGSGYPQGLKGEEICWGARIFAVADTYDAIRSHRPYSRGRTAAMALEEIRRCRGRQFDPRVVDILAEAQPEIEAECEWSSD